MTASLALIVAVAAAYLAAHVVFDWLGRRYLIVSGAEYLVLGILLGPHLSGLLSAGVVASLAPIVAKQRDGARPATSDGNAVGLRYVTLPAHGRRL